MKTKFSLLVFLLLPFSAFAYTTPTGCDVPWVNTGDLHYWNNDPYNTYPLYKIFKDPDGQKSIMVGPYHWSISFSNPVCPPCSDPSQIRDIYTNCVAPALSAYDSDPQGCSNAGGYFISTGTEQVGGTSYGASFFGGAGIVIGGDIKSTTKCATLADTVGAVVSNAIGLVPMLSKMFGSSGLKKMANLAVLDKFQQLPNLSTPPKLLSDLYVGTPRLPAPNSPSFTPVVPIIETPIPPTTNTGGVTGPSRSPTITADPNYSSIPDTFIPLKSSGAPIVDYSTVDRFNSFNNVASPTPQLSDIISPTGSSSLPVKETFDFSKIISNSAEPITIATVPVTTTKMQTFSGTDPVDVYTTVKNYPDSSSSSQTVKINTITHTGTIEITTLSSTGESSTVYEPINVPLYTGTISGVPLQAPTGTTFSPPTTSPAPNTTVPTSTSPTGTTVSNPNSISGQSSSDIINAKMPSYALPDTPAFVLFDSISTNEMVAGVTDMLGNIRTQLSLAKTSFDNTKSLLQGSWTPPQFSEGSCGNSMAFNFHGRHVDFCPPITDFASNASPLFSSVVSIAGTGLAISIFMGGF